MTPEPHSKEDFQRKQCFCSVDIHGTALTRPADWAEPNRPLTATSLQLLGSTSLAHLKALQISICAGAHQSGLHETRHVFEPRPCQTDSEDGTIAGPTHPLSMQQSSAGCDADGILALLPKVELPKKRLTCIGHDLCGNRSQNSHSKLAPCMTAC